MPKIRSSLRALWNGVGRISQHVTQRIIDGPQVILIVGGANGAVKLHKSDVQRIEVDTGKRVENLPKEDLTSAMQRLGILPIELTPKDHAKVLQLQDARRSVMNVRDHDNQPKFCATCGASVNPGASLCEKCGEQLY